MPNEVLRRVAVESGIIDPDAVDLAAFAKLASDVHTERQAAEAVLAMRKLKPQLFRPWNEIHPDAERRLEEAMNTKGSRANTPPIDLKAIDVTRLSDDEMREFERAFRGQWNATDIGLLKAALDRQQDGREVKE